jgi:hypothetical protein
VNAVFESYFFKQLQEAIDKKKIAAIHPLHYVINMIAMCVFPFIAAPLLKHLAKMGSGDFNKIIEERTELVPRWMEAIMQTR